jgi:hypothetical protein
VMALWRRRAGQRKRPWAASVGRRGSHRESRDGDKRNARGGPIDTALAVERFSRPARDASLPLPASARTDRTSVGGLVVRAWPVVYRRARI